MCGISAAFHFGARKKEPVNHEIMNTYEEQYGRGQEGFGLIRIGKLTEPVQVFRATEPIKALLDLYMNPMMMGIFHHRSPTSTKNSLGQTHPMCIEDEKLEFNYATVHNGGISNSEEMYKKHKELDFLYRTYYETWYPYKASTARAVAPVGKFNDSESLAVELARFLENKIEKLETEGEAAFIVLQCTKDWKPIALHFGRSSGKPLNMLRGPSEMYLSSAGPGDELKEDIIYTSQIATPTLALTERPFNMKKPAIVSVYTGGYGGHDFGWGAPSRTSYKGMCTEVGCREERVQGSIQCVMHCDPTILSKAYGVDSPNKLCKEPKCHKKARQETGSSYCKRHKKEGEKKMWTCKEFQDKECFDCKHTKKENKKLPFGFRTEAQEKAYEDLNFDAQGTEIKTEDTEENEDYTTSDQYCMIDAVIHEFFEGLDNEDLPIVENYGSIIQALMKSAHEKIEAKLIATETNPAERELSMGDKALEAENFLLAEDYARDAYEQEMEMAEEEIIEENEMIKRQQELNNFQ